MLNDLDLILQAERLLVKALGPDWSVSSAGEPGGAIDRAIDARLLITAPDGSSSLQVVEIKRTVFPRDITMGLENLPPDRRDGNFLLVAPFLSRRSRELLESANVNYIDMTGNMRVCSAHPPMVIRQQGAAKNPERGDEPMPTLRGASAARVVRALCDYLPPATSRAIAARARVSPGYVSKIIGVLEKDALVEREGRGPSQPIQRVDWAGLIRRWSTDYRLMESNRCRLFLAPQGVPAFLRDLEEWASNTGERYAITGSFAASQRAPVAPPSLLFCYVDAVSAVAEQAGLMRASSTGNVYLCQPLDPVVFERTWSSEVARCAALPQVAVDCLTGPDRMPTEAEALLEWMMMNEDEWRLRV